MTMPLLEGLDGVNKMSKSLNNYVGITDAPGEMFSKIVSMPDSMIWRYYELLSFRSLEEIERLKQEMADGRNPKEIKIELAKELIARFHGEEAAENADRAAGNIIREGELTEDAPLIEVEQEGQAELQVPEINNRTGLTQNSDQAKEMLNNGRVKVDWQVVDVKNRQTARQYIIQAGKKKIAQIVLKK